MRLQNTQIARCTSVARSAYPRMATFSAPSRELRPAIIRPSEPEGLRAALAPRLNQSQKALLEPNSLQPIVNSSSLSNDGDLQRRNDREQAQFRRVLAICTGMSTSTVA
jgi:hypothetical protein